MQKNMKIQQVFYSAFIVLEVLVFIYAVSFMSDFYELFGLMLEQNAPVAEFHDMLMQGFNKEIFAVAIIGVITFVISLLLQVKSHIPDRFAVIVLGVLLVGISAFSVYAILQIIGLEGVYSTLDFSFVVREGGVEYLPETRAFTIGMYVYAIQAVFALAYAGVLANNHFKFLKLKGGR